MIQKNWTKIFVVSLGWMASLVWGADSDMRFTTTGGGTALTFTDSSSVVVSSVNSQGDAYFRSLTLTGGGTGFIQNQTTLQGASTFFVSSASVDGQTLLARTSGNVGIGIANPQSGFHMNRGDLIIDRFSDDSGGNELSTRKARLTAPFELQNGYDLGGVEFYGSNDGGTGYTLAANISPIVTGTPSGSSMPTALTFSTYGTSLSERVRISSGGYVGIGTTAPGAVLQVNTPSSSEIGLVIQSAISQTANITEWRDGLGGVALAVDNLGSLSGGQVVGANSDGYDLLLTGGRGTGSGNGGSIVFRTTVPGAPGPDPNIPADVALINQYGNLGLGTSAPQSTLHVNGGVTLGIKRITSAQSPYTVLSTDNIILADASGGAITITLPVINANLVGRVLTIKKIDSSNNVTIQSSGGNGIEGPGGTVTLTTQFQTRTLTPFNAPTARWYYLATF